MGVGRVGIAHLGLIKMKPNSTPVAVSGPQPVQSTTKFCVLHNSIGLFLPNSSTRSKQTCNVPPKIVYQKPNVFFSVCQVKSFLQVSDFYGQPNQQTYFVSIALKALEI